MGLTGMSVAGVILFLIPWSILWMAWRGPLQRRKEFAHRGWRSHCLVTGLPVVSLLCVFFSPNARLHATAENGKPIELTQVDFFSLADWQHKSVAIEGFVLGMTRAEATRLAQAHGLQFLPNMPTRTVGEAKGPCRQASCAIYQVHGNYIGIDLYFDATDHVSKISVSVSVDMDPQVSRVNVSRRFRGLTREFFDHYSDSLRNRIFGPVEGKEKPFIPASAITRVEYNYPQAGVTVRVTIDKRDDPAKPYDLDVDFATR